MFGIPIHLLPIAMIVATILFFVLLRAFRTDPKTRKFLEQTLGDDSPEAALQEFIDARERLLRHRQDERLHPAFAQRIDEVLSSCKNDIA